MFIPAISRMGAGWLLVLCAAWSAPGRGGDDPPAHLPVGAIVAFLPDPRSPDYRDAQGMGRWLATQGWALCDGTAGTPDLNHRLLLGTVHPQEAGQSVGSRTHTHRVEGETGPAYGREQAFLAGRGQVVRVPEEGHRHRLDAAMTPAEHLPLSHRVLFIMKIR